MSEPSMTVEAVRDIHTWFGLTYSNYLVLPRTLLQSMPDEWQARFVGALEELQQAFAHIEHPQAYKVDAAEEHELGDLSDAQLKALDIDRHEIACTVDHDHQADSFRCNDETLFDSAERAGMESSERVLIPCADPIPAYNRGRTHIPPLAGVIDQSR